MNLKEQQVTFCNACSGVVGLKKELSFINDKLTEGNHHQKEAIAMFSWELDYSNDSKVVITMYWIYQGRTLLLHDILVQ